MMDNYSNYPAPELSIAMEDVKKNYLSKIINYHKNNPEYLSISQSNYNIEFIINNNLDEWEKQCLNQAFINANVLDNNKIKISYTGWIVAGFEMVIKELIILSSNYYIIKIQNYDFFTDNNLTYHNFNKFPILFYIKKKFPKINFLKYI
jgi:hypothetical protein